MPKIPIQKRIKNQQSSAVAIKGQTPFRTPPTYQISSHINNKNNSLSNSERVVGILDRITTAEPSADFFQRVNG